MFQQRLLLCGFSGVKMNVFVKSRVINTGFLLSGGHGRFPIHELLPAIYFPFQLNLLDKITRKHMELTHASGFIPSKSMSRFSNESLFIPAPIHYRKRNHLRCSYDIFDLQVLICLMCLGWISWSKKNRRYSTDIRKN